MSEPHEPEQPPSTPESPKPPKLEQQLREADRAKHYSRETADADALWYRQFAKFHGLRHPREMGEVEIGDFLKHRCVVRNVAASTLNQALNALVFFYREVMKRELKFIDKGMAKREKRMPGVLTVAECKGVLEAMAGVEGLMGRLLYGCGLRVRECLQMRVQDVDVAGGVMTVRAGQTVVNAAFVAGAVVVQRL